MTSTYKDIFLDSCGKHVQHLTHTKFLLSTCPSCETICVMLCATIACHCTCSGGSSRLIFSNNVEHRPGIATLAPTINVTTYLLIQNCRLIADRYLQYPHHLWCRLWRVGCSRLDSRTMDSTCRPDRPPETRNLCPIPPNSIHTQ